MKRFISLFVLLICLQFFLSHFVYAQTPQASIEIAPSVSEITLHKPDEEKSISYTITNNTGSTVDFEISALDFKQQDGGKLSFLGQDSGVFSYSLASFLSLETNHLHVEKAEKKIFTVTVKNREDLSPGGHYAAIIVKSVPPTLPSIGNTQINPSLSSFILLHKTGGERFNLSLTHIDWPTAGVVFGFPENMTLTFRNEGNIHLVPYGTVVIKDFFNREIYKGAINISSLRIFPETQRYIDARINRVAWSLPLSFNTVIIQGNDSLKKTHFFTQQTFLYINPYILIVIILVLVVCVYLRKRR